MPHICDHQFFPAGTVVIPAGGRYLCIYCGQIRIIGDEGVIYILKEHGEVRRNQA